jgi:DNA-binding MarR family transcriptional regulator
MTDHNFHKALEAYIPEPEDVSITRAKRILQGLGFCGHYLHFHGGGRSGQVPILCMLDRCGGQLSQQELGLRFELKPGSLSEILSKMEAAGLIERTRDTKDRRQLFVHLTQAGQELAWREHENREAFRRVAFSALTVEEQEQLAEMLEKIRVTWEELDA